MLRLVICLASRIEVEMPSNDSKVSKRVQVTVGSVNVILMDKNLNRDHYLVICAAETHCCVLLEINKCHTNPKSLHN